MIISHFVLITFRRNTLKWFVFIYARNILFTHKTLIIIMRQRHILNKALDESGSICLYIEVYMHL